MAPISTEAVNQLGHTSESRSGAGANPRTQAVSIEIPVLVRGSRRVASVPGQPGKLEHFSEETTTVVVFAQGAVVRLVGSAKAGQLVGLTNRQTGKEALCRIVNIKHFPDTRGYVEIEFNHAMNGFWQDVLSQEAAAVPATPTKNGSSPLDALGEMSAEQLLRANPKELKAQLLEMAALLKTPAEEVPAESSVAPGTAQGFWKRTAAPEARQPVTSPEPPAAVIEAAPVDRGKESSELAVEDSEGDAPLAGIAQVTGGAEDQPGATSPEADLEVSEIGVSEFDLAADVNNAAVTSEEGSLAAAIAEDMPAAAETGQQSGEASLPAGEWPLASSSDTLISEPEISSDSSQGTASFAVGPPSAAAGDLDADLESLLQPLHGLSESSGEVIAIEAQTPEAWPASEAETVDPQLAAALARHEQDSEEPEQAAVPVENLDRDDLSPEDMWNAGSIVHSNLDRPSAGSSDADMRASEEKTMENTRLAELKAALVTPSAAAAMREDDFPVRTLGTEPATQALSLESVWSLFRSLNKSVPATANESEHDAASLKLFASGAIADVRQVESESARAAEPGASHTDGVTNAHPRQEAHGRAKVSGADESADRGESEDESESSQESAADHHVHASDSGHDEEDETDEAAPQNSEAEDDEDSSPPNAEQHPRKPDIVPQWYSTNPAAAAASKPWSAPSGTAVQGTMAPTLAKRETGGKSILAHAVATLVLLAAGAAAFHTLRPSVSYLMRPPAAPPAVDPDENAAARDAAVASLSVPPLPADIQARVAKTAPGGTAKPAEAASGSSGVTPVPVPGGTSAPLRVGEGVRSPRVLSKIQPIVPYAASASGIGGDVILSVVVDNGGRVATARVVSGPGVLRNAALEAVRQWEYEPALQNGRPVAVQIYVTVNFPRH